MTFPQAADKGPLVRSGSRRARRRVFDVQFRKVTLTAILWTTMSSALHAQRRMLVGDEPSCVECGISVTKVVTLGRADDSLLLSVRPMVQQTRNGEFLVIGNVPRDRVLVYAKSGALVGAIGRGGQGPGELSDVSGILLTKDDSLIVIDAIGRRISVFSPERSWKRTFRTEFAPNDIEAIPGGFVGGGVGYSGLALGQPLHRLDPDGEMQGSFGGPIALLQRRPSSTQRFLARSNSGFWSMRPDRYELQLWTPGGELVAAIDRQASWFPDREVEGARNVWSDPIHPWVCDAYEDDDILWVLSVVADNGFRPTPANFATTTPQDQVVMDTMLDAIDLKSGTLLASQRFPWVASSFTNNGLLVSYHEDDGGIMVLDLLRPAVVRNR